MILYSCCRYLEVESSGKEDELHFYYSHSKLSHRETFSISLADNQWHTLALSLQHDSGADSSSGSQVTLRVFIDCRKLFERQIPALDGTFLESTQDVRLWLGRSNASRAHFKVGLRNFVREVSLLPYSLSPVFALFTNSTY